LPIWSVDFSENNKTVATRSHVQCYNAPNSISAGALPPDTPLGELTALPQAS